MRLFAQEGVKLAVGTDSGGAVPHAFHGYSTPREVEILADCCMTPMQALVAATGGAARVMHLDATLGTLEPGKHADFLVLAANPLDDIRNTRRLEQVWVAGRKLPD